MEFKLNTNSYDIVICDILMPDILGPELYQQATDKLPNLASQFIFVTGNVVDIDPAIAETPPVMETIHNAGIKTAMSNSFGFGGTNATLVFQKR